MDAGNTFSSSNPNFELSTCNDCNGHLNHAVTIVGYTTAPFGTPTWIIQNSWGSAWGDAGFFYISMNNVGTGSGQFNMEVSAVVAVTGARRRSVQDDLDATLATKNRIARGSQFGDAQRKKFMGAAESLSPSDRYYHVVINHFLNHTSNLTGDLHHLVSVEKVTSQVVNGILLHVEMTVKSHVTQAVRLVKGVVLRRSVVNNTDAWETRSAFVSYPVTAAPSDSSSLALGLGLGLGLLAFGSVVAIMVMRRRAASRRAVFAVGSNMQLHEGLLAASAE